VKPITFLPLFLLASLFFPGCSDSTPIQGRPLPEWLQALKADDATRRLQAVQVLAGHVRTTSSIRQLMAPQVIQALEGALTDRHQSVRLQAALALASRGIDSTMTVPVLLEGIRDGGIESVHQSTELALAHHSRTIESSLAFVLQLMERRLKDIEPLSASRPGQRAAVQMQKSLAAAQANLKSPAEPAVLAALDELAATGLAAPPSAVPAIGELLKHSNPRLRAAAAASLGRFEAAGFPALLELTSLIAKDPVPAVRAAAVRSAMRIDPHSGSTVSFIYGALTDGDPGVRRAAAESLAGFGPSAQAITEPLSSDMLKAIIWPRNIAMRVIEPAIAPLLRVMADPDPGVRAAARPLELMPAVTFASPALSAGSRRAPASKSICTSTIGMEGLSTR
jgi:HEAT repeat protein